MPAGIGPFPCLPQAAPLVEVAAGVAGTHCLSRSQRSPYCLQGILAMAHWHPDMACRHTAFIDLTQLLLALLCAQRPGNIASSLGLDSDPAPPLTAFLSGTAPVPSALLSQICPLLLLRLFQELQQLPPGVSEVCFKKNHGHLGRDHIEGVECLGKVVLVMADLH